MMNLDQLVKALGGTKKAADLFGVEPSAVSNWKAKGEFPRSRRYDAFLILQQHRLEADPAVFGQRSGKAA